MFGSRRPRSWHDRSRNSDVNANLVNLGAFLDQALQQERARLARKARAAKPPSEEGGGRGKGWVVLFILMFLGTMARLAGVRANDPGQGNG